MAQKNLVKIRFKVYTATISANCRIRCLRQFERLIRKTFLWFRLVWTTDYRFPMLQWLVTMRIAWTWRFEFPSRKRNSAGQAGQKHVNGTFFSLYWSRDSNPTPFHLHFIINGRTALGSLLRRGQSWTQMSCGKIITVEKLTTLLLGYVFASIQILTLDLYDLSAIQGPRLDYST